MADMRDVIERLTERTNERRVSWRAMIGEDFLLATVGDMSVALEALNKLSYEPMTLRIAVLDEGRKEIASLEAKKSASPDYEKLYALWQAAKASAIGENPRLDEFLEALDAAPPVASPEPEAAVPEPELATAQRRAGRRIFNQR